uniref:Trafficking protein particle complex subunit 2 n=1 Tax=Ditylenchus dipsaci TaxID=166011 RepID=A0A915CNN1_9BILA
MSSKDAKLKEVFYYFVIVGHNDQPIFEIEFPVPDPKKKREHDVRHLNQFIAHAALDIVDEQTIQNQQMYLKIIDKFNEWFVSAFVTAGRMRFLVLHTQKNDEGIRQFFQEMYETYIKYSMNPFYSHDTPIKSPSFEQKAITYGRKFLVLCLFFPPLAVLIKQGCTIDFVINLLLCLLGFIPGVVHAVYVCFYVDRRF